MMEPQTTPAKTISDKAKDTLIAMIEFQLYILAQPHGKPWRMAPRNAKSSVYGKAPNTDLVESGAAMELAERGFIEQSSRVTYIVSKSGIAFYEREIKSHSQ